MLEENPVFLKGMQWHMNTFFFFFFVNKRGVIRWLGSTGAAAAKSFYLWTLGRALQRGTCGAAQHDATRKLSKKGTQTSVERICILLQQYSILSTGPARDSQWKNKILYRSPHESSKALLTVESNAQLFIIMRGGYEK